MWYIPFVGDTTAALIEVSDRQTSGCVVVCHHCRRCGVAVLRVILWIWVCILCRTLFWFFGVEDSFAWPWYLEVLVFGFLFR